MNVAALHRLFIGFTASLIAVSAFSDLLAVLLKRPSLRATAAWTLGYAAAITPITALAGYLWWDSLPYVYQRWTIPHARLGIGLSAVLVPLAIWRGRIQHRDKLPGLLYVLIAVIVFGASVFQGNIGRDAVAFLDETGHSGCDHTHLASDDDGEVPTTAPTTLPTTAPAQARFICPMHPDVSYPRPGTCRRCGMRLVEKPANPS